MAKFLKLEELINNYSPSIKGIIFSKRVEPDLEKIFAQELEEQRQEIDKYFSNQNSLYHTAPVDLYFNPFKPTEIVFVDNQKEDCCIFENIYEFNNYLCYCLGVDAG